AILAAAAAAKNEPFDLLRMGLRDDDDTVFTAAANALAAVATKDATIDVEDALARCTDAGVDKALLDRHAAIGKEDPATARMSKHLRAAGSATPVGKPWANAWRVRSWSTGDAKAVEAELDRCDAKLKMTAADDDTRLELAVAQAAWDDILIRRGRQHVQFWFD